MTDGQIQALDGWKFKVKRCWDELQHEPHYSISYRSIQRGELQSYALILNDKLDELVQDDPVRTSERTKARELFDQARELRNAALNAPKDGTELSLEMQSVPGTKAYAVEQAEQVFDKATMDLVRAGADHAR